jgi:hypothetical protein
LVLLVVAIQGCVSIQSATVTNVSPEVTKPITGHESDMGILHLSKPSLDDLIADLTMRFYKVCGEGKLTNVKTVLSTREFIIVQSYDIEMTANCTPK